MTILTMSGFVAAEPVIVINEIDADQTGDDAAEFIELYAYDSTTGQPLAGVDLSPYTIVLFNGSNERAYRKIELTGKTTSSTGYYVLGNEGVALADPTLFLPADSLQNGGSSQEGDAVALFTGDVSGFVTSGNGATTLPDLPAGAILVDAIVYDGGAAPNGDDIGLLEGLNLTGQNLLHDPPTASLARQPDGGAPFTLSAFSALTPPTPGRANVASPVLSVTVAPGAFSEAAGENAATLTITRSAPFAEALTITISSSDISEAVPASDTVVIPAGEEEVTVFLHAVNDDVADGMQTVTMTVSATGYVSGTVTVTVTDDDEAPGVAAVYINEIDSDQPGADTGEFIELSIGEAAVRALDGYVVVLFNGATGQSYRTVDLTGKSTNAQGFFVIGNANVPHVGLVIPDSSLQNGTDAVAVYRAPATLFPNGSAPTDQDLVDVVVYGAEEGHALLTAFTSSPLTLWNEGSANNSEALARVPDAVTPFGALVVQAPTPGVSNVGTSPNSGYAEWVAAYPNLGSPVEDDDGDGLSNLMEYALGSHPRQPGIPFQVVLNESRKPTLVAPKGALAAADPQLRYVVEVSTTLAAGSWTTDETLVDANTASELRVSYQGDSPSAFLRLTVIRTE